MYPNANEETRHHEENQVHRKHQSKMYYHLWLSWKSIEENSPDLLVLGTRDITDLAVTEIVKQTGQEQFEAYSNHCLTCRSKAIDGSMKRNKLHLSGMHRDPEVPKGKEASVKSGMALFAKLYTVCQNRDGKRG